MIVWYLNRSGYGCLLGGCDFVVVSVGFFEDELRDVGFGKIMFGIIVMELVFVFDFVVGLRVGFLLVLKMVFDIRLLNILVFVKL